jgi:hypothetical protein
VVILLEIYSDNVVIMTLSCLTITGGLTCDLNILGARMEALVHLFQNRGMTPLPAGPGLNRARSEVRVVSVAALRKLCSVDGVNLH